MDFLFATRERLLAVLNEELGTEFRELVPAFHAWRENVDRDSISVCGLPCGGGCSTCVESDAALTAFFAPEAPPFTPAEPLVSESAAPSHVGTLAVTTEDQEQHVETLRNQDAGEGAEIQILVSADDDSDSESEDDCDCRECRLRRDPQEWFVEERETHYYYSYNDGYGLDWNESGYFD